MSSATESPAPPPAEWPVLGLHERRVLGVMVEKAKTTPDAYTLSVNALVTGCNQKSNRDPLLDLSDEQAEDALMSCQKKGLAIKITGGRVVRWRHNLYEAWKVDKVELAILAELLLRGPQTEGELRGRASRMEEIADLDVLRGVLKPMAERQLVVYLMPENRRGTVLTHGFHALDDLERLRARMGAEASRDVEESTSLASPGPIGGRTAGEAQALAEARAEIAELRQQFATLQATVISLAEELRALKESLGAP